jgi:O-antigen/teichoic acid export membrane protein
MTKANKRSAPTLAQVETVRTRRWGLRPPRRVGSLFRIPLYRSATALVLTTGANAALGLVFWALAARLYTVEDLGRGAATVAALQLVSMLGCSGLTPALIRFIPPSRLSTRRLVEVTYLAGVSLALLCGAGVVLASYLFIEPLSVPGVVFLGGAAAFAVFTLQDGALIGLRREGWVPVENAAFGLVKIGLLIAFSGGGASGIFVSWAITSVLLVIPVNLALFLKFIPAHTRRAGEPEREFTLSEVGRFSGANHLSALLMGLPDFLMPIIVLQIAGATENGYFIPAWSLVWPLRLIAVNIANAFTAHAADDERRAGELSIKAGLLVLAIFLPLVAFLMLGSHPLLRTLFGREYASNGDTVMRLLAPGLLAYAVVSLGVAMARVHRQLYRLLVLSAIYAAISLPVSIALVSAYGIEGAGAAWLVAQIGLAAIAAVIWSRGLLDRPADLALVDEIRPEDSAIDIRTAS